MVCLQIIEMCGGCMRNTLYLVFKHLEGAKTLVRVCFIAFSLTFNCIKPHVLAHKLNNILNIVMFFFFCLM